MVPPLVTELTLSVRVAVWIRETGSGPPTHVRANSEPAASRAPSNALASQSGLGRARLVAPHTQTSLAHWNMSRAEPDSRRRHVRVWAPLDRSAPVTGRCRRLLNANHKDK
jgi:hypothetical protein